MRLETNGCLSDLKRLPFGLEVRAARNRSVRGVDTRYCSYRKSMRLLDLLYLMRPTANGCDKNSLEALNDVPDGVLRPMLSWLA